MLFNILDLFSMTGGFFNVIFSFLGLIGVFVNRKLIFEHLIKSKKSMYFVRVKSDSNLKVSKIEK